jgi:hypothetical protein
MTNDDSRSDAIMADTPCVRGPPTQPYQRPARGALDGQRTDSTGENRASSRDIQTKAFTKQAIPVLHPNPLFAMSTKAPSP